MFGTDGFAEAEHGRRIRRLVLVPFMLVAYAAAPAGSKPPMLFFFVMPVLYLVVGYISIAVGCALYNFVYHHIGGIEFESERLEG